MACKYIYEGVEYTEQEFREFAKDEFVKKAPENKFLSLLENDGAWVNFFVRAIVQDSAKKGYEKVLFPTGNTASKVEGHETIEEFKAQQEASAESIRKRLDPDMLLSDYNLKLSSAKRNVEFSKALLGKSSDLSDSTDHFIDGKIVNSKYKFTRVRRNEYTKGSTLTGDDYKGWVLYQYTVGDGNSIVKISDVEADRLVKANNEARSISEQANLKIVNDELEYTINNKDLIMNQHKEDLERALHQVQEEIRRVDSEGISALKPIYDFYENRVKNTLNKIYGKDKIERIKDEYGNEWYQVGIEPIREASPIFFQLAPTDTVSNLITGFKSLRPKFQDKLFVGYTTGGPADKMAAQINSWIAKKPDFQNIRAIVSRTYNTVAFQDKTTGQLYQLSSPAKESADTNLDAIMSSFVAATGGKVRTVSEIVVNGRKIAANAVTNVIDRTVDIVQGKASIDTLPEEAAHIFVQWLPKNSILLREMMDDIRNRKVYTDTLAEYSSNPYYQNADSTVNEEKIAIEAIGKQIARTIVGQYKDKKWKTIWNRLWEWVKSIFTPKVIDAYSTVAQDILSGNVQDIKSEINKQLTYELQTNINKAISGRSEEGKVADAFTIFGRVAQASRRGERNDQDIQSIWREIQERGLDFDNINQLIAKTNDNGTAKDDNNTRDTSKSSENGGREQKTSQYEEEVNPSRGQRSVQESSKVDTGFAKLVLENLNYPEGEKILDGKGSFQYMGYGTESVVYHDKNSDKVIKFNKRTYYDNWEDFLNSIVIHNALFPATAYKLLGFTNRGNQLYAVLEQEYVPVTNSTPITLIEKIDYMASLGFKPIGKTGEDFYNDILEVYVKDLHVGNIFMYQEKPFIIDAIIYQSKKKQELTPAQETNERGEFFFQLSDEDKKLVSSQTNKATAIQKAIIKEIYTDVHNRIILDPDTHIYSDLNIQNPTIYTSVTTAIGGKKDFTDEDGNPMYEDNRIWGNEFDAILQAVILGKGIDTVSVTSMTEQVKKEVYSYMKGLISGLTADGSIALTQVIVADKNSKIAGSIDLLLVDPYGGIRIVDLKTSWKSVNSSAYTTPYQTGEGSKLNRRLSKGQSHSVQVGVYSKLIELQGYPVTQARTEHILLETKGSEVTGFTPEGTLIHLPTENEVMVDIIVPTEYKGKNKLQELNNEHKTGNPTHRDDFNDTVEDKKVRQERSAELEQRVQDIIQEAKGWKEYLKDIKHQTAFSISDSSVMRIDKLIQAMEEEFSETNANYSRVFTVFLNQLEKHLDSITHYLTNEANVNDDHYIRSALLSKKYIDTFEGLVYAGKFATGSQVNQSGRVLQKLRNVDIAVSRAIELESKKVIENWTSNPLYKSPEALAAAVQGIQDDITQATKFLDTIGNSGVPLLENIAKLIAAKREEVRDSTKTISEVVEQAGNTLQSAMGTTDPKKLFSYMLQRDSKGKVNGQIISQKGSEYKRLQQEISDSLLDKEGNTMQYIHNPATKEDIAYNKRLFYLKERQRVFNQSEVTNSDSDKVFSIDGDYHMLTPEFRLAREQYMYQDPDRFGIWVPKKENDPEYIDWREKNMTWVEWVGAVTTLKKGERVPTGQVENKSGWFPNKEHVVSREYSSDKTGKKDLWDKEYRRIMRGSSPIDTAQREFYKVYVDTMRQEVEKLPASAMYWFEQGYIPVIRANFIEQLANKDINTAELVAKEIKDFFSITATYDGKGGPQRLPIMYMSSLQSQKKMDDIRGLLEVHSAKKLTAANQQDWLKEQKRLTALLKAEASKATAAELHPDLVTGLKAFVQMTENFHIMSGIEDTLQAAKEHLKEQTFRQGTKEVKGAESRALELYNHALDICFYNDPTFITSVAEVVGNRLMKVTSSLSIPLNGFGMINNKIVARINNRIDAIGGTLFTHKAYNRAQLLYNTEHIPGFVRTWGEHLADSRTAGKGYGERKSGSLYDFLAKDFNMVRHLNTGEGRVDFLSKIGGYSGYEAGEWESQSLVGNAILDSIQMKYTGTDPNRKDCSIRDAYEFDANTGKGKLIDGYQYIDKDGVPYKDQQQGKYLVINRIHETNDRIHGNYDPANKIMLERTLVGKMMLQFHKWVYPNFKQRYQKGKFDENIGGGMDIEGRYNTLGAFIMSYVKLGNAMDRWNELTPFQQANLKKDMADAMYIAGLFCIIHIVKAVAKGIGDDDPYIKRMKNWVLYQSDRGIQEVSIFVPALGLYESYQLMANPFAATSSIRNFAILMKDMTYYPFQDDDQNTYQRGPYKGSSKIGVDLLRVVPGGGNIRKAINLESMQSFYIGQ